MMKLNCYRQIIVKEGAVNKKKFIDRGIHSSYSYESRLDSRSRFVFFVYSSSPTPAHTGHTGLPSDA